MAGAFIAVNVNDAEFERDMAVLLAKASNLKPLMKNVGELVVISVRENFLQQGRPTTWKPLSTSTKFSLIGGSRGKILIGKGMSGGLMGSIHYAAQESSVLIGTEKIYGAAHQFGIKKGVSVMRHGSKTVFGTRSKSASSYIMNMNIPEREYLLLQDEDKTGILAMAKRHLQGT